MLDAGFTPKSAERRGRAHLGSPIETLATLGVTAREVRHLVLSHLHYDHTGYVAEFPAAIVVVQRRELQFWTGAPCGAGREPPAVRARRPRAPGTPEPAGRRPPGRRRRHRRPRGHRPPRLRSHRRVAGPARARAHPPGHVVLAADASHFYANIEDDRPFSIVDHLPSMYDAFDRIHELADDPGFVVAGHDPLVAERFETVPGAGGLVIRIA